jgi:hypothetical protein
VACGPAAAADGYQAPALTTWITTAEVPGDAVPGLAVITGMSLIAGGCAGGLFCRGLAWHSGDVTQIDPAVDALVSEWLPVPEAAARLGIPVGRIRQLLRDRKLLAVTRPDGTLAVPASFIDGGQIVKGLQGTLTLLFDCGFDEAEALRWLFTADESLPGTPIEAIARHRSTEVNRRAQALAM